MIIGAILFVIWIVFLINYPVETSAVTLAGLVVTVIGAYVLDARRGPM